MCLCWCYCLWIGKEIIIAEEQEYSGVMWTTARGKVMDISEMDDDHLINTYRLITRCRPPWRRNYLKPLAKESNTCI